MAAVGEVKYMSRNGDGEIHRDKEREEREARGKSADRF
jgi:hypothetical protein